MESGEFKKRNLPYGYRWDEEHINMVFDEKTAPIVQKIFQWKIEGLSLPDVYKRQVQLHPAGWRKDAASCALWIPAGLADMQM